MKRLAKDNKGFYFYKGTNQNLIKIAYEDGYDYKWAIGGDKDRVYSASVQYDAKYKQEGYEIVLRVNGGLFYKYDGKYYANGLEKIEGITNQDWSMSAVSDYNNDMAIGVYGFIDFDKQTNIIANDYKYRGEITGIGLLKDGKEYGYTSFTSQFNAISGRTIIGRDYEGNFYSYSIAGTTGKSGITGKQAIQICKDLNLKDCIMLDGGGSVSREYMGRKDITTTRAVKNTLILYRKKKSEDYKELYEKEKAKIEKIRGIVNE